MTMDVHHVDLTDVWTLPDALRAQVAAHPERTAVRCGPTALSYRELGERSAELAAHLGRLGVRAGDRVGLFTEPSIDLMVGVWGITTAGAAYLPLSPEYPEERLRYIIENSRTSVVVCQDDLAERLAELAPHGTVVVTPREAAGSAPDDAAVTADPTADAAAAAAAGPMVHPDGLAYVIYTSGSTGRPKGVMVEHGSVLNQLCWLHQEGLVAEDSVVVQKTPMSFDAAQLELLAPACGSTVVMGPPGVYRDPELLIETIREFEVNTLQCVPTLLQALVDTEELSSCTSLRTVFSGGEALSRSLAVEFHAALPRTALVNLYGPTECTINATFFTVDPATVADGPEVVPIGSPVRNTRLYILDEELRPVPPGETGELFIAGAQVARGYLHRPDLTEQRFLSLDLGAGRERVYRTGDLTRWNPDGTVQYTGRTDNQVKLRGYRIELDEVARAIEQHDWVKRAAVLVREEPRTGFKNLIACISLNPKEAALMDQGVAGAHHRTKSDKLQVKAQLSDPGVRTGAELAGLPAVELPGAKASAELRAAVFARKTYRFYDGGPVTAADLLALLARRPAPPAADRGPLTLETLGELLRHFGQFRSEERLLPKYAYASPGALYATQLYLETGGLPGLDAGCYYYHPVDHRLVRMRDAEPGPDGWAPDGLRVHFIGRKQAIEPVYKNNIREVLEIETGHMVGLFEEILPGYGLAISPLGFRPAARDGLGAAEDDAYLGSFALHPPRAEGFDEPLDLYVQAHPGRIADLPAGQYRYVDGHLDRLSDELVLRRHVIAINQQVYERASFGITAVSRETEPWLRYVQLGRALHRYQANGLGLGLMSAGYSSESGNPLPAARRIDAVLGECGIGTGPSYFFVGGRISAGQRADEGMKEDAVHMRGPTELIRNDLLTTLPDYMVPNNVLVLEELPQTANGKIDVKALAESEAVNAKLADRPFVAPRTRTEQKIAAIWGKALKYEPVSKVDDFFESNGDSLAAVTLIRTLNRQFGTDLPAQILFDHPTIERLARHLDGGGETSASRLVRLHGKGAGSPVYCWPGLGGYPMNLRLLAGRAGVDRPFYGVQAFGLNAGETPYPTIGEMAAEDIREIQRVQPEGPYVLWGYSFGARVAFEAAWRLEQAGERVDQLCLIAPGSPEVRAEDGARYGTDASYTNPAYVSILFSVFAGGLTHPGLGECLRTAADRESFLDCVGRHFPEIDREMATRIVDIVAETFEFSYTFRELAERRIDAPITIFKARGDDYSFLENAEGFSTTEPTVVELEADHYSLLKEEGIEELTEQLRHHLRKGNR